MSAQCPLCLMGGWSETPTTKLLLVTSAELTAGREGSLSNWGAQQSCPGYRAKYVS